LGADFGGALATTAGFVAAWIVATGRRLRLRHVAAVAAALLLLAVALLLYDAARPPETRSHTGELARRVTEEGPAVLLTVAGRKWGMNWRILQNPWYGLSLAAVAFASLVCYHALGARLRPALSGRRDRQAAIAGILATGLVGLIVNDSGVVVAAYAGAVLIALLVGAVLEELRLEDHGAGRRGPDDRGGDQR
jgi:hypothetical protein